MGKKVFISFLVGLLFLNASYGAVYGDFKSTLAPSSRGWLHDVGLYVDLFKSLKGESKKRKAFGDHTEAELESLIVRAVKRKVYDLFQEAAKKGDIAEARKDLKVFLKSWKQFKDEIPLTLFKKISALEIVLFEDDLTERVANYIIKMDDEQSAEVNAMLSIGFISTELTQNEYGGVEFTEFILDVQNDFFSDILGDEVRFEGNKVLVENLDKRWLSSMAYLGGKTPLEYLNIFGWKKLQKEMKASVGDGENILADWPPLLAEGKANILKKYNSPLENRISKRFDESYDGTEPRWVRKGREYVSKFFGNKRKVDSMNFEHTFWDSITMMSFGFSMSDLNKTENGGYDFADYLRDSQFQFFRDILGGEVLLANNKITAMGLDRRWTKGRDALEGMSALEYLNLHGWNHTGSLYRAAIKSGEKESDWPIEFRDENSPILKKYSDPLGDRVEHDLEKNYGDESLVPVWVSRGISYLKKFQSSKESIKNFGFKAAYREFNNTHAKLYQFLKQGKKEAFVRTVSDEIFRNELKIARDIYPALDWAGFVLSPLDSSSKDQYMDADSFKAFITSDYFDYRLEPQDAETFEEENYKDKIAIAKLGAEKKLLAADPNRDITEDDILRELPDFLKYQGRLMSYGEFQRYLKNIIARKNYITEVNHSLESYYKLTKKGGTSLWDESYTGARENGESRNFIEKAIFPKAIEIVERVTDEFEGSALGGFFYTDHKGRGAIPSAPYFRMDPEYQRHEPNRKRKDLIETALEGEFQDFSEMLDNFMLTAVLNPRHHRFIRSDEFYSSVASETVNFKDTNDPFFNQLGNLWGYDFPLVAYCGGDEHRLTFRGPDTNVYHISFDFDNFRAAEMTVRQILGRPYRKDDLIFSIHSMIPQVVNDLVKEFKAGKHSNKKFADYFQTVLLEELAPRVVDQVWVDLNPENNLNREYLAGLEHYVMELFEKIKGKEDLLGEDRVQALWELYYGMILQVEDAQGYSIDMGDGQEHGDTDFYSSPQFDKVRENRPSKWSVPLTLFMLDKTVKRSKGDKLLSRVPSGEMATVTLSTVGSDSQKRKERLSPEEYDSQRSLNDEGIDMLKKRVENALTAFRDKESSMILRLDQLQAREDQEMTTSLSGLISNASIEFKARGSDVIDIEAEIIEDEDVKSTDGKTHEVAYIKFPMDYLETMQKSKDKRKKRFLTTGGYLLKQQLKKTSLTKGPRKAVLERSEEIMELISLVQNPFFQGGITMEAAVDFLGALEIDFEGESSSMRILLGDSLPSIVDTIYTEINADFMKDASRNKIHDFAA